VELHLRVVVYEPGQPGEVRAILDSVKSIQEIVGGYFECVLDQLSGLEAITRNRGVSIPPRMPPTERIRTFFCNESHDRFAALPDDRFHRDEQPGWETLGDARLEALRGATESGEAVGILLGYIVVIGPRDTGRIRLRAEDVHERDDSD
jgi:hypothetical protein